MSIATNLMNMYMYTSIPIVSCNILFYCITSLSNSIVSTKNVFNFIYEHKDSDYIIYKNELKSIDLIHKINIINELIFDTIKKYIPEKEKYNKFLEYVNNPIIEIDEINGFDIYSNITINYDVNIIDKIDKPILYSIISISEILQNINNIMNNIKNKIDKHQQIYFKSIISLCLKNEIIQLKFYSNILDMRYKIFIDLLKIYMPHNSIKQNQ
jgi:hypothetical protein